MKALFAFMMSAYLPGSLVVPAALPASPGETWLAVGGTHVWVWTWLDCLSRDIFGGCRRGCPLPATNSGPPLAAANERGREIHALSQSAFPLSAMSSHLAKLAACDCGFLQLRYKLLEMFIINLCKIECIPSTAIDNTSIQG